MCVKTLPRCRAVSSGARHKEGWGAGCNSRTLGGGRGKKSKKGAGGWERDGGRVATGIYLTKHSCHTCGSVRACVFGEEKERKDYCNTSSMAHSNGGKTPQDSGLYNTHSQPLSSSPPSLLPFPPGPPSSKGSQKRGVGPDNSLSYPNRIQSVHKGL